MISSELKAGVDESILGIADVRLSFGGVRALNGVTFELQSGQWCGLIGPNGSGKSSCLNVLTGFYKPQEGSVRFHGRDIVGRAIHHSERLGVVRTFQHPELSGRLSLLENVLLGAEHGQHLRFRRRGSEPGVDKEAAVAILTQLGCAEHIGQCAFEAPYGIRKRAEIARALLAHPEVLLFDEPAAGLSSEERTEVITTFKNLRESNPMVAAIVVEHDVQFVSRVCDVAVALDFGKVIASGPISDVLGDAKVRAAFLGEP